LLSLPNFLAMTWATQQNQQQQRATNKMETHRSTRK
jgi:hypothetical protein